MEGVIDIIAKFGFPIAACLGIGYVFYKIIIRIMDENKAREEKWTEQSAKMIEANNNYSNTLKDVANTINISNETNRLLVDKVDTHLNNIDDSLRDINGKLSKQEVTYD